jgi:predicted nucleic acid-binding protein
MGFLLDTNILSEVRKGKRKSDPCLWHWWEKVRGEDHYVSVLVLGEIRKGIDRFAIRDSRQARVLERWIHELKTIYHSRVIGIDPEIADRWGRMQAIRPVPAIDGLIAATASAHDLVLATRNERDFSGLGIVVVNPFKADPDNRNP